MLRLISFYRVQLTLLIVFFTPFILSSQALNHVQGEILIVLEDDMTINRLESRFLDFESQRTKAVPKKLKTNPIPLWKIHFDHSTVHEYRYLESIRKMEGVKMAQFNHLIDFRTVPNDPQFSLQWQYVNDGINGDVADADIDMDLAWDIATGGLTMNGDTIVACVIDGGMDPSHQDFDDNLWKNRAEIPDNGIDDDNNGYVDDYNGWSTYEDNDDVFKGGSHGTPVAGIIGAQGNNGVGVSGVNWDVKLMIIRGGGNEAAALEAYAYPYMMRKRYNESNGAEGAFVVTTNASWGSDLLHWEDAPIWCSFYDSLGMVGILNCGATANANYNIDVDGDMPTSCPSDYLISVTNMSSNDRKVTGAGWGLETIDLGAFGAGTWTTSINNGYSGFGGTSGATPHVSGTVALAYSSSCQILADLAMSDPGQAALLVKEFILSGVKPNESLMDITVTGGKLNVNNTMLLLENFCGDCPFPVSVDIDLQGTDKAMLTWTVPTDSTDFDIVFRARGEEQWDTMFNIQSPVLMDELEACTSYEFKIKTRCIDDYGSYSFNYVFETDGCCTIPPGHNTSNQDDLLLIEVIDILATDTYTLEYKLFGADEWKVIIQDSTIFDLPATQNCEVYYYRYASVCEDQEVEFSEIFTTDPDCDDCQTFEMCQIEGDNYFEYIDKIKLGSFVNETGRDDDGYGDYTFANAQHLKIGHKYEFQLIPGFNDNQFNEFVHVYIDLNIDGQFDESELVLDSYIGEGFNLMDTLFMPYVATSGYSKMRVIMSFQEISNSCESLSYGEIEDYCVYLDDDVSACLLTEFRIDSVEIGTHEATLGWSNPNGTMDFNYRYRIKGSEEWTANSTQDSIITIEDLASCSLYEIQVRGNCLDGLSRYSEPFEFKTDCTSSAEAIELSTHVNIHPNPFFDYLIIQIPQGNFGIIDINIYEPSGKKIMVQKGIKLDNQNSFRIDNLNNLSTNSTILMIELVTKNEKYIKKLMYLKE